LFSVIGKIIDSKIMGKENGSHRQPLQLPKKMILSSMILSNPSTPRRSQRLRYKTAVIDSRSSPPKMILLSMILLKDSPLQIKPVLESRKGNRLKPGSNIPKI
jgi:hypothetical protein